eukprot:4215821-Pleurochrysis_carterae.AAC.1
MLNATPSAHTRRWRTTSAALGRERAVSYPTKHCTLRCRGDSLPGLAADVPPPLPRVFFLKD